MLEQLESRQMMAVSAYVTGWTLVVEGDSGNNWVNISRNNGLIWVDTFGPGASNIAHIDELHVTYIEMRGNAGNDILTIDHNVQQPATVFGDAGADYLYGGGGTYTDLWGHNTDDDTDDNASDTLISGSGDSYLWGQGGNDHLYTDNYAASGVDFMFGGNGNDTFYTRGHDGNAYAEGEAGHDKLVPYQNATQHVDYDGGSGTDNVDYRDWTQPVYINPSGGTDSGLRYGTRRQNIGSDVEYVDGTDYDDFFSGTTAANIFYGWGGDDMIYGASGNDSLMGMDGNDTIFGENGNDFLYGGYGDDELYGSNGNDTIDGNHGVDYLYGAAGHDQLHGGEHTDYIYGGSGNDKLVGGGGSDYLDAHDGIAGNDLVYGDYENGSGSAGSLDVAYIDLAGYQFDPLIGIESASF